MTLNEANYLNPFQPGVRTRHGMEIALVQLLYDLWFGQDRGSESILALLDLSAGFNTINDSILLDWLRALLVGGIVLCWSASFVINSSDDWVKSHPWPLLCGVLQGLILSPLLFNMRPLDELNCHYGVRYHQYVYDTQFYMSTTGKLSNTMKVLWCLKVVRVWMGNNRLQIARLSGFGFWGPLVLQLCHLWCWIGLHCHR